jgi:glucose/arabinose dehydrogenase
MTSVRQATAGRRFVGWILGAGASLLLSGGIAGAATLPAWLIESLVAEGLRQPTAMAFAPDGRLFIAEQSGQLRVVSNGTLLAAPFVSLTVSSLGERGLLGIAFDPAFAANQFVYVYYTATSPVIHNRVSRFTANGDVAVAGSEVVIVDLEPLSFATNHNGGAIHFGPDGKLYIAVGDNANGSNSQTLSNRLGKILRVNADGSIPTDNPFYGSATGDNRAIWALGLRNPFTFAFQSGSGTMFINDVGQNTWEEINEGIAGTNYGWPLTEGPTTDPDFTSPLYAYDHGEGCAISGGAFHQPATAALPTRLAGSYFFADFCGGWIRVRLPGGTVADVASGISAPVDLQMAADGSLYYLARGSGTTTGVVYRIRSAIPIVNVTANGVEGPLTLAPDDPLRVAVSFHPGNSAAVSPAELYFAVATPAGVLWWDPVTQEFGPNVARTYSGPLPAILAATLIDLPSASVLPPGTYRWVVLVDADSDGVPAGTFRDFVQTTR